MIRRSPLYEIEADQGAVFEERHSREIAEHFGNPQLEYESVRRDVGALDICYLGRIRISGRDRVRYLHNMLSNDIRSLKNHTGCHATLLTHQGRMETDLFVYAFAEEFWLEIPPAGFPRSWETLNKYIVSDMVTIEETAEEMGVLSLQGPRARECMEEILESPLEDLPPLAHQSRERPFSKCTVVHRDRTGCDGYDLWLPMAEAKQAWKNWTTGRGIPAVGYRALNWLRTEAGIPWYGTDMDDRRLPMEMGLMSAISLNKGCYRGQEIVARVLHRGHLDRSLAGLMVYHHEAPEPGAEVTAAEIRIGEVTSAILSPRLGKPLALAVLKSSFHQPGTRVNVSCGGKRLLAEVVQLPLSS